MLYPIKFKARYLMKKLIIFFISAFLLAGCVVKAQIKESPEMRRGTVEEQKLVAKASGTFLEKLDKGKIDETWETVSPLLQQSLNQKNWFTTLHQMRDAVGMVKHRKIVAIAFMNTVDDAPVGEYAMLGTETHFQNLSANERVALHNDQGTWKIMGYFIEKTYKLKLKP